MSQFLVAYYMIHQWTVLLRTQENEESRSSRSDGLDRVVLEHVYLHNSYAFSLNFTSFYMFCCVFPNANTLYRSFIVFSSGSKLTRIRHRCFIRHLGYKIGYVLPIGCFTPTVSSPY